MKPLLTIAIPTWNRSKFIEQNLEQLSNELDGIEQGSVEILVSDNCSTDDTEEVVQKIKSEKSLPLNYVKNKTNIGWGLNFFQCFNLAKGKYVLLLGDDDLLYDGALKIILDRISDSDYGVIYVRPYGFNSNFRSEYPGTFGSEKEYEDVGDFLLDISSIMRMISACVINKGLLNDFDTSAVAPGNFAHLHLILTAMLRGKKNLFINRFLVGIKRNNSANYNFYEIFVEEFWALLDSYIPHGLQKKTISKLENTMLFTYYPYCILRERLKNNDDHRTAFKYFERFKNHNLFRYWVAPILRLPKVLAILWGGITTFIGRTYNGELLRGITFFWKSIIRAKLK